MLARSFSHTVRTRVKVQGKSSVAKAFFFLLNSFLKNTSLPFANSALDSTAFVHSGWTILTHEHCIDSRIICCFHRGEWYKRSRSSTPPKIISGLLYRTKEQDYYFYRTKGHINVITFFRWMIYGKETESNALCTYLVFAQHNDRMKQFLVCIQRCRFIDAD